MPVVKVVSTTNLSKAISYLTLAVLAMACIYSFLEYPAAILRTVSLGTVAAIALAFFSVLYHPGRGSPRPDAYRAVSAVILVCLSMLITHRAAGLVPGIVDRQTVFAVHLRTFYYALHYLLTIYITRAAIGRVGDGSLAQAGLVAVLVHGLCNGAFFLIQGERFGFLYGLTLTTFMIHIHERAEHSFTPRLPGMLAQPLALFFGWALISSLTSVYPHTSLEQLIRLGNWVVCFFLVLWIVRDRDHVEHLIRLLLLLAAVAAVAGLVGVAGYAARAGLHKALRARLSIGNLHGNAVATFLAAYVTLGCGLLVARQHRLKGYLLPILIAAAVISSGLGYVSRAGWENPFTSYLSAGQTDLLWGVCLSMVIVAVIILTAFIARFFRSDTVVMLLLVLMLLCIFLTYSRSGAVGLLTGLTSLLVLTGSIRDSSGTTDYSVAGKQVRTVVLILLLAVPAALTIGSTVVRTTPDELQVRFNIWKVALNVIRHRPLVGVGLDNHFVAAYCDVLPVEFGTALAHPPAGAVQDLVTSVHRIGWHAHNLLLETGEAMGVVGLVLLLWLLTACARFTRLSIRNAARTRVKHLTAALFAALVALLVPHLLVMTLSRSTLLPLSFWILLALLAALSNMRFTGELEVRDSERNRASGQIGCTAPRHRFTQLALRTTLFLIAVLVVGRTMVADVVTRKIVHTQNLEHVERQRDMLRLLTRLQPWNANLKTQLADLSDPVGMVNLYRRAIGLRPLYAPYHWKLGWSYWMNGQFSDALSEFQEATRLDPYEIDGGHYRHDLGLAYSTAGQRNDAIRSFVEAIRLDPKSIMKPDWGPTPVGVGLNPVYTQHQQTGGPTHLQNGCIAWHLNIKGAECSFRGEPALLLEQVVQRCLEETESGSEKSQTIFLLKRLVELLGRWEMHEELGEVLDRLELLLEEGTREAARVAAQRIDLYIKQGETGRAFRETMGVLRLHDSPMFRTKLGSLYLEKGLADQAVIELEKAAEAWDPSVLASGPWAQTWLSLGMAYEAAERPPDALRAYDMAQFLKLPIPHYIERRLAVGRMLHASGAYAQEHDVYEKTLGLLQKWDDAHSLNIRLIGMLAKQSAACCLELDAAEDLVCAPTEHAERDNPVCGRYSRLFRKEMVRLRKTL